MRDRTRVSRVVIALGVLALLGVGVARAGASETDRMARRNPKLEARIELGRRLFFEPVMSRSGQRSCASCHAPEHGFSDPERQSIDDSGLTPRHSQTIVDSVYNTSAHWDGEFNSVEELVVRRLGNVGAVYYGAPTTPRPRVPVTPAPPRGPIASQGADEGSFLFRRRPFLDALPLTRGLVLTSPVPARLMELDRYGEAFKAAFGTKEITLEHLALAVSAYCYSVESTESPYDRHKAGNEKALSASAKRGLDLFEGRAGCAQCHVTQGGKKEGEKALFTDFRFHNTGVAWHAIEDPIDTKAPGALALSTLQERARKAKTPLEVEKFVGSALDVGRGRFNATPTLKRAFKTPTLRDVTRRAPYFHDGRCGTLEEVVRYYAAGCGDDPKKDRRLKAFAVTDTDVEDLVRFLESLTGDERPGLAKRAWRKRAGTTRVRIVNFDGAPIRGLKLRVQPAGDVIPVKGRKMDEVLSGETDSMGYFRYRVPASTHARIVLPKGAATVGSLLVPDTCRNARIQVRASGRMSFVIVFPNSFPVPPTLVAEHTTMPPQADGIPRSLFQKIGVVETKDARIARYSGWVRADRVPHATLRLPGMRRSRRGGTIKLPAMSVIIEAGTEKRIDLTAN